MRSHRSQVVRISPTGKVRAVGHLQVLRTSRHPDRRIYLALPHQQFRKPLRKVAACLSRADLQFQPMGVTRLAGLR